MENSLKVKGIINYIPTDHKVISFSLWGTQPKYLVGAIENARLAKEVYPDWICRFYIGADLDITSECINTLKKLENTSIYLMEEVGNWNGMFWRFLPASDPRVSVFLSRDADSRLNYREKAAVELWLNNKSAYGCIMRDHPWHTSLIMGGMWGAKRGCIENIGELISDWDKTNQYNTDQEFLARSIFPIFQNKGHVCFDPFFAKIDFPTKEKTTNSLERFSTRIMCQTLTIKKSYADMNKILIIGESCLDEFVYCDAIRLAPDVPVPVLEVIKNTENPGMAQNVLRNIEAFIQADILTNDNWKSIKKTRYVHENTNHTFIRVDTNAKPDSCSKLLKDTSDKFFNYDIIVISDYNKGFLSKEDIKYICENHKLVFLDTKKILGDWANGAAFIKINDFEYNASFPYLTPEIKRKLIHTDGGNGCYFQDRHYPTNRCEVKDSSGAGDSFLAALVVKYFESKNIEESILFANEKASEVVKHKGVTIICP